MRTAGNSVRLYTNGVLHSQFNPSNPASGSVWDLLMLPAFFYDPGAIKRILVLGVGGGAAIRLLDHFVKPQEIIGVELNPLHIQIAKQFFGVGGKGIKLIRGDAVDWLRGDQGPRFNMIIDDLFTDAGGEPERAVAADAKWFQQLLSHLSPNGVLVMNFVSLNALQQSAYFSNQSISNRFCSAFRLTNPRYENVVAAFLRRPATGRQLRDNLIKTPGLNPRLKGSKLQYRIRVI